MKNKYAEVGISFKGEGQFVKGLTSGIDKLAGIFAGYAYVGGKAIGISTDGVGSKIICYNKKGDVYGAAFDLLAMNVNDLAAEFIDPLFFVDYVALHKTDKKLAEQMNRGLRDACKKAGVFLAGGETASLPDQIKENTFDWAGTAVGIDYEEKHRELIARRGGLAEGLYLVGIEGYDGERDGYTIQSNGLTLARKLFDRYEPGKKITNRTLIDELTSPSIILSDLMCELKNSEKVYFFAPITGGGYRNVARVLPKKLDAEIEFEKRENTIFDVIQREFDVSDKEMYTVFNMGHLMAIGTKHPGHVINEIQSTGLKAREIGELKKGEGKVVVNGINVGKY